MWPQYRVPPGCVSSVNAKLLKPMCWFGCESLAKGREDFPGSPEVRFPCFYRGHTIDIRQGTKIPHAMWHGWIPNWNPGLLASLQTTCTCYFLNRRLYRIGFIPADDYKTKKGKFLKFLDRAETAWRKCGRGHKGIHITYEDGATGIITMWICPQSALKNPSIVCKQL